MGESRDPDDEQASAYLRVPWPIAAIGLVLLLGLVLGAGVFALQQRPPSQELTTATELSASEPPATQAPPESTPVVALTSIRSASAEETPTAVSPQPATTVTTAPTIEPELLAEVVSAYQHYWDVRASSLWTLDESQLSDVMDGDHLRSAEDLIAQLRQENRAIRTEVDHHYSIVSASDDKAVINDNYLDSSLYVDFNSRDVISEPSNDHLDEQYQLTRFDSKWKVVSLVRLR